MANSTIKNPHVPGSVLAESTGNKTYAQHLAALYSAYSALSTDEKLIAIVKVGNTIYRNISTNSTMFIYAQPGASKCDIESVILGSSAKCHRWTMNTSGITHTEYSSDTFNGTVQLLYG